MPDIYFEPAYLKRLFPQIPATGKRKTILLAEHDDANFAYFQVITRRLDFTLLRATDGIEAIQMALSDDNISLVLLNIYLPIIDGYEAAVQIRNLKPGIPIIAVSSSIFEDSFYEALKAGCCDYLAKPFHPAEYREVLETWTSGLT